VMELVPVILDLEILWLIDLFAIVKLPALTTVLEMVFACVVSAIAIPNGNSSQIALARIAKLFVMLIPKFVAVTEIANVNQDFLDQTAISNPSVTPQPALIVLPMTTVVGARAKTFVKTNTNSTNALTPTLKRIHVVSSCTPLLINALSSLVQNKMSSPTIIRHFFLEVLLALVS